MIRNSDVPSGAAIERQAPVLGTMGGQLPLQSKMPEIRQLLQQRSEVTMVQAATGSGKSVLIPTEFQQHIRGKLLALNPSTIDTENVCLSAKCKSCYRMGGKRYGGDDFAESRVVFVTVGLAAKWYTSHGIQFFEDYDGVFCDELHAMETDPHYSMLWEVFRYIATKRSFLIMGASATFSDSIEATLDQINTCWVRCHERPHPLERNIVTVYNVRLLYQAMADMTASILDRGESCLLFLPGRSEIEDMQDTLTRKKGISEQWISPLHADLEQHQIQEALAVVDHPKAILATSIAETSITLTQIDHVLDAGFCRTSQAYDDIISSDDFTAPASVQAQREGRAGRVKTGSATRFVTSDSPDTRARPPISLESIESVVALENFHLKIQAGKLSMCPISEDRSDAARQRINALPLSEDQLWKAVTELPFPLRDAAVFFKSMHYKVTFEVAAVIIFKNTCTWPGKMRFRLSDIVTAVSTRSKVMSEIGRLSKARHQFIELRDALKKSPMTLTPTTWNKSDMEEAVAVAFLECPERLVWQREDRDPACFLGEPLVDCMEQGYSVGVLFRNTRKGLQCSLHLPCTDWVLQHAKIEVFTHTAKCLSDSTLFEFRVACILKLRSLGYDTRLWQCQGGKQETQFAVDITLSPSVELCIIFPNGNRLARQKQSREPRWLRECADEIATALHTTASNAVAFVGDAVLSPGLQNAEVYENLGRFFHS